MLFKTFIQQSIHFNRSLLHHLQNSLLPSACLLCGMTVAPGKLAHLCFDCYTNLPILPHHCPQCAQFLSTERNPSKHCKSCKKSPPPFTRTFALFPYEFPIVNLIRQLKFHQKLANAAFFGDLLSNAISYWYHDDRLPDVVIPVPLHASRLKARGFNQAHEILKGMQLTTIIADLNGASRMRRTAPQSGLSASQREANMLGAFQINHTYTGLHIAVLDDVVTTSRTITAFCQALKENGALRVDVWCCARRG